MKRKSLTELKQHITADINYQKQFLENTKGSENPQIIDLIKRAEARAKAKEQNRTTGTTATQQQNLTI